VLSGAPGPETVEEAANDGQSPVSSIHFEETASPPSPSNSLVPNLAIADVNTSGFLNTWR